MLLFACSARTDCQAGSAGGSRLSTRGGTRSERLGVGVIRRGAAEGGNSMLLFACSARTDCQAGSAGGSRLSTINVAKG